MVTKSTKKKRVKKPEAETDDEDAGTKLSAKELRREQARKRREDKKAKAKAREDSDETDDEEDDEEEVHRVKPVDGFQISTGSDNTDPYIKMLVYGEFGSGKTVLAASSVDVPSMRSVLFLNAEAGTKSIKNSGIVKRHGEIDYLTIKTYIDFAKAFKILQAHVKARDSDDEDMLETVNAKIGAPADRKYYTVIVDSLTAIDTNNINRLLGINPSNLMNDPQKLEWEHYGKNASSMQAIMTEFRKLGMNVIMTAPCEDREDKEDKIVKTVPMLTGSSRDKIKGFFDIVGYLEDINTVDLEVEEEDEKSSKKTKRRKKTADAGDGETVRRLWLKKHGNVYAKSRVTPKELMFIVDPTMSIIDTYLTK